MLRTLLIAVALFVAMSTVSLSVSAKPQKSKTKTFDFEGDTIQTEYMRPDQMTIEAISKRKDKGFIKIRTEFIKEIVRSAEDL
jgi:hypothetical protein